jgi:hypothetical protein
MRSEDVKVPEATFDKLSKARQTVWRNGRTISHRITERRRILLVGLLSVSRKPES